MKQGSTTTQGNAAAVRASSRPSWRPKRWPALAAVLLATGVTVANSGLVSSQNTRGMIAAAAEVLSDPSTLFAARSPGVRPEGALYDTKPGRAPADTAGLLPPATERVLTSVRERPPDRKSTRLNSSHVSESRMPSSA